MTGKPSAQNLGYIRVSSVAQNTDRQLDGLTLDRVFTDKLSGKDTNRPELQELLKYARSGDTVHVHSLDRLGRNLDDLRLMVKQFTEQGITVRFEKENLVFSPDTSNAMNMLLFNVMAAFAEFERSLIRERQREGVQLAKAKGLYKGRKREMTDERIKELQERIAAGESKVQIAKDMRISRDTLYRYLKEGKVA
ncbi:MAG: recombinase family protein [Trichlorobacter sp.]|nr:recombinase family protein [Trichlorobacter sp.]